MAFFRVLTGIALILIGFYAGWTVILGFGSGEIMQMSKHGNAIFHRAIEPDRYWIAMGFWLIATVMLIGGGVNVVRKNI